MHGLHDDEAGTRVFIINLPDPKRSQRHIAKTSDAKCMHCVNISLPVHDTDTDKKKSRKGIIKHTVQASVVYIQFHFKKYPRSANHSIRNHAHVVVVSWVQKKHA